jgi:uncharacterized protein YggE
VLDASAVGGEPRIGGERLQSGSLAQPAPLLVVSDGEHQRAVGRVERVVRRDRRVSVAHAARRLALGEHDPGLIGEQRSDRVEHRYVHVLPVPGRVPREQRQQDPLSGEHSRDDVHDGDAEPIRRPVGGTGDAHEAALALEHRVVARLRRAWSILAVPGERRVDQPRMRGGQRVVVEPEPREHAGAEVLHHDIGARDERVEHAASLGALEVQRHALLVPVDAQEIRALAVDEGRPPRARVVAAARLLDLDHPRAHVGEQHRAVRARQHARQIQHRHTREWTGRMVRSTRRHRGFYRLVRYWPVSGVPEEVAMNRSIPALAVALLAASAAAAQTPSPAGPPVIVVNGTATVERAPDRAFLQLSTESRAPKPEEAQQKNAQAMTGVQQAVKKAGIPADAIRTLGVNLREDADWVNGKRVPRGFVVTNSIEVRVDDLDGLGKLMDAAVTSGATGIGDVRFDLKDRAAAEREALKLAVADAKGRAEAAAAGAGLRLGSVLRIEEQSERRVAPMPMMRATAMAAPAQAPTPVEAGQIEIVANVTLTVAIQ